MQHFFHQHYQHWILLVRHLHQLRQGYDILKDDVIYDILGTMGFVNALRLVLRVCRGGLSFLALPCNSHSFMSSSVHKRSSSLPYGDEGRGLVVVGNQIAYRSTLLIILSIARSILWAIENPSGSKCVVLPAFEHLLASQELLRTTSWKVSGLQLVFVFFQSSSKKHVMRTNDELTGVSIMYHIYNI